VVPRVAENELFHGKIVEPVRLFWELSLNCWKTENSEKNANKANNNPNR
jgi:hypothetical protein